jgi:microcystin-dependent protein
MTQEDQMGVTEDGYPWIEDPDLPADMLAWTQQAAGAAQTVLDAHAADSDPHGVYLRKAGGTMTGPIDLPGNAATALQAVPKQQLDALIASVQAALVPTGAVTPYAGTAAPAGWLLAQGQAVSRTTYAALFAVCSTTYGVGDGSTTFNLPNLKGRAPIGLDAAQTEFNALNKTGGTKTHALTVGEMPSHLHAWQRPRDSVAMYDVFVDNALAGDTTWGQGPMNTSVGYKAVTAPQLPTGGGVAHNNLQPYITFNFIIKT